MRLVRDAVLAAALFGCRPTASPPPPTNGASGAGHKACAQACAKAGVPLGLLSSDGTLYVPVSSKPGDPQNSKLMPYVESKVKVTGTHRLVSGLHTIEIKTVSAAS